MDEVLSERHLLREQEGAGSHQAIQLTTNFLAMFDVFKTGYNARYL